MLGPTPKHLLPLAPSGRDHWAGEVILFRRLEIIKGLGIFSVSDVFETHADFTLLEKKGWCRYFRGTVRRRPVTIFAEDGTEDGAEDGTKVQSSSVRVRLPSLSWACRHDGGCEFSFV